MSGCNFHARDIDRVIFGDYVSSSKKSEPIYEVNKIIMEDLNREIISQKLNNFKGMLK